MKTLKKMIDIHSHLLPCVDDGSDSLETSRSLLSQYVAQGVDRVICTPHQNKKLLRAEVLRREFAKFSQAVQDLPVRLSLGAELLYYRGAVKDLACGEILTLAESEYVLVEFPVMCESSDLLDALYELTVAGYKPIVAHIERYANLSKKDYSAVKEQGALIQVNAHSFKNKYALKLIKYLLKNGQVDFIATDCHDTNRRDADFTAAKEFVEKKFPKQYNKLFNDRLPF